MFVLIVAGDVSGVRPLGPDTAGGKRLAKALGVPSVTGAFGVISLVDTWGTRPSGTWPVGLAEAQVDRIWRELPPQTDLVLVGEKAAQAVAAQLTYFSWRRMHRGGQERRVCVLPHPGQASWWRDPANKVRASRFCKQLVAEAKESSDG